MKSEMLLAAGVLALGSACGFAMQTASPNPTPAALPSSTELPSLPPPPPPEVPKKIRVSQGVMDGLLIHRVEPVLHEPNMKAKGDVVLAIVINKEGNVVRAAVVKVHNGNPILAQSALEAVKEWKYHPFLLNGEPIEVETTVTLHFKKQSGKSSATK